MRGTGKWEDGSGSGDGVRHHKEVYVRGQVREETQEKRGGDVYSEKRQSRF